MPVLGGIIVTSQYALKPTGGEMYDYQKTARHERRAYAK